MIYVRLHEPDVVPDELLGPFQSVGIDAGIGSEACVFDQDGVEVAKLRYGHWRPVDNGLTYGHAYERLDVIERAAELDGKMAHLRLDAAT